MDAFTFFHTYADDGACRGVDPERMFPVGNGKKAQEAIERAKQVCANCPIKDECFEYAIEHEEYGVWGGTSEEERKDIRKYRKELVVA